MPRKPSKKKATSENQIETIIPDGIKTARIRDMSNVFNPNSIRYEYENTKRPHFAFFVGAGISKESGIKLASEMIKDFKKVILADEGLELKTEDEINAWFATQSWYSEPKNKYSCLFQKAYSTEIARRNYIEDLIARGEASLGYIVLANFIASGYVDTIITTNFDDLIYQACTSYTNVRPVVYSLGGYASEMSSMLTRPKVLKIHGDFLFSKLKNTDDELAEQDPNMSQQVKEILSKYDGLIVIGYSGCDDSVMNLLNSLPEGRSLYWCATPSEHQKQREIWLNEKVRDLLKIKDGYLVEIQGFDRLMESIREIIRFDPKIIVNAFTQRQKKLYDELNKFKTVLPETGGYPSTEELRDKEIFTQSIDNSAKLLSLYAEGEKAFASENYNDLDDISAKMLEIEPNDYRAHILRGLVFHHASKNEDSEKEYRMAIELNPNESSAYNNLGNLLAVNSSHVEEVEELFTKAIELNPTDDTAYSNLGLFLGEFPSRFEEAERALRKAVDLNPATVDNHSKLVNLLSKNSSKLDEAEEVARRTVKIDPNNWLAQNALGNILLRKGQILEAIESLTKGVQVNPSEPTILFSLATAYKIYDDKESAKVYAEKGRMVLKDDQWYFLACYYAIIDNAEECLQNLSKAINQNHRGKLHAKRDLEFDWIREDPRFKAIIDG